jgi:predicted PurR-regulated permease PerM
MGVSSSSGARPADEGASVRGAAARPTPAEGARGAPAPGEVVQSVAPVVGVWADALGRAGSRAAQTLLIAAVVVGVVWVLLRVTLVVIALLVALILAAAVAPAVKWLERKGWSNLLATLAAFLGILALVGGVLTGIVFSVRSEWGTLTTQAVEGWEELQRFATAGPLPIDTAAIDQAARQVGQFLSSGAAASGAISGISAATQVITGAVLVIVILFFFLKDGETMWNFLLRWTRGERRAKLAESIDRGSEVLGGYVRGTAAIALADGILIGAFLVIFRVPLALPLAVIAFVTAFIPVIGATIAGALAALVALVTNGPLIALALIAWVIVVNQIEGNVLQPIIMGRTLSLHPLLILLALTVGTIVGGIFGAILAVPYTAVTWAVLQVWATGYQAGPDPVLGADPLDPEDQMRDKATLAQRFRYQRMRLQHRRGARLGATEQDATGTNHSDKADTESS